MNEKEKTCLTQNQKYKIIAETLLKYSASNEIMYYVMQLTEKAIMKKAVSKEDYDKLKEEYEEFVEEVNKHTKIIPDYNVLKEDYNDLNSKLSECRIKLINANLLLKELKQVVPKKDYDDLEYRKMRIKSAFDGLYKLHEELQENSIPKEKVRKVFDDEIEKLEEESKEMQGYLDVLIKHEIRELKRVKKQLLGEKK